jgi:hypothetical protein
MVFKVGCHFEDGMIVSSLRHGLEAGSIVLKLVALSSVRQGPDLEAGDVA